MEWQGAVTGAAAALLGRIVFDWLRGKKTNHATGMSSQQQIHQAVREELESFGTDKNIREIVRSEVDGIIRNEFDRDPRTGRRW